jgi:DNA polymerase I-like protein with 3'-5' exonuclease and polymerase domains
MEIAELKPLNPGSLTPALNPTLVTDGAGLEKVKKYFERISEQSSPEFAIDYETNVVDVFHERKARTLQLGDKNEQYMIDLLPFAGSTEALVAGQGDFRLSRWAKPIIDVVGPAFDSKAFLKIGQNLPFEYMVSSWNFGMRLWNVYSIDIAEKIKVAGAHTFKDLRYFSLANMVARYFGVAVDKTQQTTFDLVNPITQDQIIYGCLDLRMPIAIKAKQIPELTADQLMRVTTIENDAVGFFVDIHLNGWNINRKQWKDLVDEWQARYDESIKTLDTNFLPVVGNKKLDGTDLEPLLAAWKSQTFDGPEEVATKAQIKATKDKDQKDVLRKKLLETQVARKARAAESRKHYMAMRKKISDNTKAVDSYIGEAAINYGSNPQLVAALRKMKGFNETNLPSTDDGVLKKLEHIPVISALRDHRTYAKLLETYGTQWFTEYESKPGAETGWVNPYTKKIHSTINQLEAETGRTSSVKPNSQNLPADERLRACFIADEPNPDVLVCTVCDELVVGREGAWWCPKCSIQCEVKPEENAVVSCDMAGAELRIIAEESGSKQWIDSFNNGWDLHSVGTELLYPEEWSAATQPGCAYYEKDHQKCKCPGHKTLRDDNKATNFLLAYGGGPAALGEAIGKTEVEAKELMRKHEAANPEVWAYLENSGKQAVKEMESRSKCGRRRLFNRPDFNSARELAKERMFESLKKKGKLLLNDGTKLKLEDMRPEEWAVKSALRGMYGSIERRGKNLKIQSLNATIIKLACGSGYDPDGKPYLWHTLPLLGGKAKGMVHDEIIVVFPRRNAEAGLALIQDAFKRAGAEFLSKVSMLSDGRVADYWKK